MSPRLTPGQRDVARWLEGEPTGAIPCHPNSVRRALDSLPTPHRARTIRGHGYLLLDPESGEQIGAATYDATAGTVIVYGLEVPEPGPVRMRERRWTMSLTESELQIALNPEVGYRAGSPTKAFRRWQKRKDTSDL